MTDYASTLEFRPWNTIRLARLSADLREMSDLGTVGPDGRKLLRLAAEYVDALVASTHTNNAMTRATAERVRRVKSRRQKKAAL